MQRYLIGSKLLGLTNNRDIDYLYLDLDGTSEQEVIIQEDGIEKHVRTLDQLQKSLNFEVNNDMWLLYNYQLDREIVGSDFPIEYHILDHKENVKKLLKKIVKNKYCNFNKRITTGPNKSCSKIIYHVAYNLFILENNSPIITDEQKQIIQQLHDGNMPITYLDELVTKISVL